MIRRTRAFEGGGPGEPHVRASGAEEGVLRDHPRDGHHSLRGHLGGGGAQKRKKTTHPASQKTHKGVAGRSGGCLDLVTQRSDAFCERLQKRSKKLGQIPGTG